MTMLLTRLMLAAALCVGCLMPAAGVSAEPAEQHIAGCCGETCCCSPDNCPCVVEDSSETPSGEQAVPARQIEDYRPAPRIPLPGTIHQSNPTPAFNASPLARPTSGRAILLRKSVLLA
ncbi:MAG: hypothetical protein CMJ36_00300 [Phycisphaerae bacterium]|nr:hypothetical protein [Phycisphaerae bacterium]